MRRAYHGTEWILNGSEVIGLCLGSDLCAEHEWGVDTLRAMFALQPDKDGIERRIIRKTPDCLTWIEDKNVAAIQCKRMWSGPTKLDDELRSSRGSSMVCAWSESAFGIAAYAKTDAERLKVLWDAFTAKDVAFWTNVGAFHLGGGLIFAIASRIPEEQKSAILESDLDRKRLLKAAEATGIEKELKAAGCEWFALSPRWDKGSGGDVIFWLNPCHQSRHNFGWFTVPQLREWAAGRGPIVMTAEEQRKHAR